MSRPVDPGSVRESVSNEYVRMLESGGVSAVPSEAAGYDSVQVAGLPEDACANSFGCGNPLAVAGVRPGDTVVDLGCGAGLDLLLAARKTGPSGRVIGIDMTDEMIALARRNLDQDGILHGEVRKGIIEDLPIESASVDWVISNCVVNLSPEKPRVFAEIARVLRPGGQMLVSDIVVESAPRWIRWVVGRYSPSVAGAVGEAAYVDGLRRAGLEAVEIRDRQTYDESDLRAMLASGAEGSTGVGCRAGAWIRSGGTLLVRALTRVIARSVARKVTSIRVYARRALR